MTADNLSLNVHVRWWVRPLAFCAAVLGFLVCLVAPKTGTRYTNAVIRWIMRVGVVVGAAACAGDIGTVQRPFIPTESDSAVLAPNVQPTPVEPGEGVIRCDTSYDGVTVCWMVTDSVSVVAP